MSSSRMHMYWICDMARLKETKMHFRCEIFDGKGNIIDLKHIQVSVLDVQDATKNEKAQKLKKKAQQQGFGFRVKRMEE